MYERKEISDCWSKRNHLILVVLIVKGKLQSGKIPTQDLVEVTTVGFASHCRTGET